MPTRSIQVNPRTYKSEVITYCLPKITDDWWQELVFNNLSPLQRETVLRNDIHEIKGLDLAALLRVLDRNWFVITSTFFINVNNKERGNIRTMQEVRNTWAHITPNDISKARVIDDVLNIIIPFCDVSNVKKIQYWISERFLPATWSKTRTYAQAPLLFTH